MHPDEMPVEPDEPEHEPEPDRGPSQCACWDCGRAYGDEYGFPDLNVPHDVWQVISPTGHEGGLLCPSCLCRRLHAAGLKNVPVHFGSGPCAHTDFRAANAELLEVLEPFASLYGTGTDHCSDKLRTWIEWGQMRIAGPSIGDFRRARNVHAKHKGSER